MLDNPNGQIPTRRFVSEPGFDSYDTRQFSAGWLAEHRFNDAWKVRQNFRHTTTRVDYRSLYPDVYSKPNAPFINAEQTQLDRFYYVNLPRMRTLAGRPESGRQTALGPNGTYRLDGHGLQPLS